MHLATADGGSDVQYVRPDVATLVIGQAYGNACMLLAAGQKGRRAALPHARIKMATPRINRSFGTTTDVMIKANELEENTDVYIKFLADFTGKDKEQIYEDCARDKCASASECIRYAGFACVAIAVWLVVSWSINSKGESV
jgi:ATP-dependent Clp protease, protease subunit